MKNNIIALGLMYTLVSAQSLNAENKVITIENKKININKKETISLSVDKFVNDVVKNNANILIQKVQKDIVKNKITYEEGVTDTIFTFAINKKDKHVPNGIEDIISQQGQPEYEEDVISAELGFGGKVSTGAKWSAKLISKSQQSNTISKSNKETEYSNNLSLSFNQPLLKGRGSDNTLIKLNIAKLDYDLAINEYNKKMMNLIGGSIDLYWRLYGLQNIRNSWQESLNIANKQLDDVKFKLNSGKANRVQELTIRSAVSLREIELKSTESKIQQIQNQMLALLNLSSSKNQNIVIKATDNPYSNKVDVPSLDESFNDALKYWPEFEILKTKMDIANKKIKFSQNQTLPSLDLLANVNTNSLGYEQRETFNNVFDSNDFVSWEIGLQLSVPIGNNYANSNLDIEKLNYLKSNIELVNLNRTLNNGISQKIHKLQNTKDNLAQYTKGLNIRKELLDIEAEKLNFGKVGINNLFNEQEKYISFQRKYLNNIVQLKLAQASLEKVTGKLLKRFNINIENKNSIVNSDGQYK